MYGRPPLDGSSEVGKPLGAMLPHPVYQSDVYPPAIRTLWSLIVAATQPLTLSGTALLADGPTVLQHERYVVPRIQQHRRIGTSTDLLLVAILKRRVVDAAREAMVARAAHTPPLTFAAIQAGQIPWSLHTALPDLLRINHSRTLNDSFDSHPVVRALHGHPPLVQAARTNLSRLLRAAEAALVEAHRLWGEEVQSCIVQRVRTDPSEALIVPGSHIQTHSVTCQRHYSRKHCRRVITLAWTTVTLNNGKQIHAPTPPIHVAEQWVQCREELWRERKSAFFCQLYSSDPQRRWVSIPDQALVTDQSRMDALTNMCSGTLARQQQLRADAAAAAAAAGQTEVSAVEAAEAEMETAVEADLTHGEL